MQNTIKEKLKNYLVVEEETASKIFEQLAFYIYSLESGKHDLYILAKLLPEEDINKMVAYFDGDTIKLPSKEQHKTLLLLSVCFYLKVLKGYSWERIKEFLDLPENNQNMLSSISIGGKINKLQSQISDEFLKMLQTTKIKDMDAFLDKFKTEEK